MTTTKRRQPLHWTNTVGAAISEGLSECDLERELTRSRPGAYQHQQLHHAKLPARDVSFFDSAFICLAVWMSGCLAVRCYVSPLSSP